MASIQFLGAAGTVTGARFLVSTSRARVLVDCGLFQGLKELRLMNWAEPPFEAGSVDSVVLTHAHLDHCGYLPRLERSGFRGRVYATPATIDLCGILLPDSGHLQEEQAEHANRHGYSKHSPALPLYTAREAMDSLRRLEPCPYGHPTESKATTKPAGSLARGPSTGRAIRPDPAGFTLASVEVADGVRVRLVDAGHILGSAIVEMWVADGEREVKLAFSGDLGRYGEPLLADPTPVQEADHLLVESTYGDRIHRDGDSEEQLARIVRDTAEAAGCLLIPAFAVDRTQQLLYALHTLEKRGEIPDVPVYVDSPMAIDATAIFLRHPEAHRMELRRLEDEGANPFRLRRLRFVRTSEESHALDGHEGPMVLISASGMATGGRVLHHLEAFLPDDRATVLFVGYQAAGTRGRSLVDGAKELKLLGRTVPVRARIRQMDGFSAHADRDELLRWLSGFRRAPATTFLIHGEGHASQSLAEAIHAHLGWRTGIPGLGDVAEL